MKRIVILICTLMISVSLSAQDSDLSQKDTTTIPSNEILSAYNTLALGTIVNNIGVYKLYSTDNVRTFLKLNTQTGQVWQVHFAVGDKESSG